MRDGKLLCVRYLPGHQTSHVYARLLRWSAAMAVHEGRAEYISKAEYKIGTGRMAAHAQTKLKGIGILAQVRMNVVNNLKAGNVTMARDTLREEGPYATNIMIRRRIVNTLRNEIRPADVR